MSKGGKDIELNSCCVVHLYVGCGWVTAKWVLACSHLWKAVTILDRSFGSMVQISVPAELAQILKSGWTQGDRYVDTQSLGSNGPGSVGDQGSVADITVSQRLADHLGLLGQSS